MTIITLHQLFFGHCVTSLVIVFEPQYFSEGADTLGQDNYLRFHTMTSKTMVRSYYCLISPHKMASFSWEGQMEV